MAKKFLTPIEFVSLAIAPISPTAGQTYFDTTLNKLRTWNGTQWAAVETGATGPTGAQGVAGATGSTGPTGANAPVLIIRHAWAAPYDYIGTAPEGAAESSTGWTLTRITVANDGTTTTATASDSWNNRVTAVYS